MFDTEFIDRLNRKIVDLLPKDLGVIKNDLEKNIRATIQATLQKLDMVTREEFDVQRAVLLRTREKLEQLEAKIAELEKSQTKE